MIICCVSDLHGRLPTIPVCDVLVIAGDVAPDHPHHFLVQIDERRQYQQQWFASQYAAWERQVPAQHIVAIPGNHDWCFRLPDVCKTRWLITEGTIIDGVKFWGNPYVPLISGNWSFESSPEHMASIFEYMPDDVDVLLNHAPPYRCMDLTREGDRAGCKNVVEAIYQKRPRKMICGHIHQGRYESTTSRMRLGPTDVYNAAMYGPDWKPIIITL